LGKIWFCAGNDMLSRFENLADNDRRALVVGGIGAVRAIAWFLMLEPLYTAVEQAEQRKEAAELRNDRLLAVRDRVMQLGGQPSVEGVDPLSMAKEIAKGFSGSGARVTVSVLDASRMRLNATGQSYEQWVSMLFSLQEQGIHVDRLDVSVEGVDGLLRSTAVLGGF
jgi:type II secretory pathway component PulM